MKKGTDFSRGSRIWKERRSVSRRGPLGFFPVTFLTLTVLLACFPLGDGVKRFSTTQEWAVGIYGGDSPLDIHPDGKLPAPIFPGFFLSSLGTRTIADPFLVREGESWYMFFEWIDGISEKGKIGFAASKDLIRWDCGGIVLEEPFHMSYPYIFRWENEYYMIPETSEAHAVFLYRAEAFPLKWKRVSTMIRREGLVDPSIFRRNGKWWLFAGDISCDTLRLYCADDLQGPWREHPQSPIHRGNLFFSRPAGRVILWEGKIIRFAQQDIPCYGKQVWAFEVLALTEDRYEERPAREGPVLQAAGGNSWNGQGMHHADLHEQAGGKWIAAVDGFRDRCSVGVLLNKVCGRFQKFWRHSFQENDSAERSP